MIELDLFGKKLVEMDFAFIKYLVDNKIPENFQLEFKGQDFLNQKASPEKVEKDRLDLVKKIWGFCDPYSRDRDVLSSHAVRHQGLNTFVGSDSECGVGDSLCLGLVITRT